MKRGVSPIIATVILIAMAVMVGFIVYGFGNGFITQLSPAPDCTGVVFYAGIYKVSDSAYSLEVDNNGNVPISGFQLIVSDASLGQTDSEEIKVEVKAAESLSKEIMLDESPIGKDIAIIPIIKNAKGEDKVCSEEFARKVVLG